MYALVYRLIPPPPPPPPPHTVSAMFVFNKDIKAVDPSSGHQDVLAFIKAVKIFVGSIVKIGYEIPLYKIFPTKLYRNMTGAIKEMYSYGLKYAEELQAKGPRTDDAMGLLEEWLTQGKMSQDRAILMSIDMFAAGVDTVSLRWNVQAVTNCFFIP